MLLVYAPYPGARHRYIFGHVLGRLLGLEWRFETDKERFISDVHPYKLNYSDDAALPGVQVQPAGMLEQSGLPVVKAEFRIWKEMPVLFQYTAERKMGFDVFAAAFWMLTRYEEMLPHEPDEHGRFPWSHALAVKAGHHRLPLVDIWAGYLGEVLRSVFHGLQIRRPEFVQWSTLDIDILLKYGGRGAKRAAGGWMRDLLHGRMAELWNRTAVAAGRKTDPFDNFQWQEQVHTGSPVKRIYFFQVGDHGPRDKNIAWNHPRMAETIKRLSENSIIGLHPSYASHLNPEAVAEEKQRLEKLLGRDVLHSRQHFLRMQLPATYHLLEKAGIRHEHSMGWSETTGFRAGTAVPFLWYDALEDRETSLTIHPFCAMDVAMQHYLGMDPEKAVRHVQEFREQIRLNGGQMITVFHNESLCNENQWRQWNNTYQTIVTE